MEQYLLKSAIEAEIDKRIKVLQEHSYENHKTICHLDSLKQSLSTLKVKEVEDESYIMSKTGSYTTSTK